MKFTGADALSRSEMRFIHGYKILKVSRALFLEFVAFHKGMTTHYEELLNYALSAYPRPLLIKTTAAFAALARQNKTNTQKIRDAKDMHILARRIDLIDFLPPASITRTDAATAILAATCASDHYYAPQTIATKVYCQQPFLNSTPSLPFTSLVLKGIRSMRSVEETVGVVLGKDVLEIFNCTLQPDKFYFDLLLVTFD